MRVTVLIDAYNLYYAGRKLCGRGAAGWRWLDVRSLATTLVGEQSALWPGATVARVVYCTARISAAANPSGAADQNVYLRALLASGSVDHIEYGNYISKVIKRPLATENRQHRPVLVRPDWPVMVQRSGLAVPDATFIASGATYEEKGSDVNVAAHLLVDVLAGGFDAAVVISNDSDLRWPVEEARRRVPVGMVNPGSGYTAGRLSGTPGTGAGRHWWRTLRAQDFAGHQLPDPVGSHHKPVDW
jgi:NYN domain